MWGGRRLETVLHKKLPGPGPYGEAWEISDCGEDRSVVIDGPWSGCDLASLIQAHPEAILGRAGSRFPLLFKTIEAAEPLSVQVHPADADRVWAGPACAGKTEAWVILDAEPGARIVYGPESDRDREALFRAAEARDSKLVERLLPWFSVRRGDVVFLPAGTIHAIGAGILLLEVQQTSDITYRIHDWDRAGLDGKPRELHLAASRQVRARPQGIPCPIATLEPKGRATWPLVACEYFRIDGVSVAKGGEAFTISTRHPQGRGFVAIAGVEGNARLTASGGFVAEIGPGDFLLIPAACPEATLTAKSDRFVGILAREGDR